MPDRLLDAARFCAVDVETSGLYMDSRLVEVGAVRFDSAGILGEFHTLVDPLEAIQPGATAIHGITDGMVRGCPTPGEVVTEFLGWLGGSVFVAHNARFDARILALELAREGLSPPDNLVVDTVVLARKTLRGLPNYRLETLIDYLGIDSGGRHRGFPDAVAAMEIFRVCLLDGHAHLTLKEIPGMLGHWSDLFPAFGGKECGDTGDLQELARMRVAVEIIYEGGNRPGIPRMITPLGIFGGGARTYLRAYCHRSGIIKTFRVDRIAGIRLP